jgi:hypothetical protein
MFSAAMPMKKLIPAVALGLATFLVGAAPPAQGAEKIGTSVSDQAVAYAMFSVHNPSTRTISYEVQWGKGAWKSIRILPGETYDHSYKLNAKGEFPGPSVRFDRIVNRIDGQPWYKDYAIDTSRVVRGGFGPGGNTGTPKAYFFEVSADRRSLELYRK